MRRRIRIAGCAAFALLAGCDRSEEAIKGVDTTLPEKPATLTGTVSFPSDYIPEDLRVCAESAQDKKTYCDAKIDGSTYTLDVPAGSYHLFAQTSEMPGRRAYYTEFVACGSYAWCESHERVEITVQEGETKSGVDPGDWYGSGTGTTDESSPAEPNETYDYEPADEPPEENGVDAPSSEPAANMATRSLVGSLSGLFSSDDYPASAVDNNEQGTVGYRLIIGASGRVSNCYILSSSGSPVLDRATCSILQRRARFTAPANGGDSIDGRINWRLE